MRGSLIDDSLIWTLLSVDRTKLVINLELVSLKKRPASSAAYGILGNHSANSPTAA